MDIGLKDVVEAQKTLERYLKPTPLVTNAWLSEALGCQVYLKLESLQPIGSFKIRGAINRLTRLTDADKKKGVIAASAGNHAQGVAWAAKSTGVDALIVMPKRAPLVKIQNTRQLGAQVRLEGEKFQDAYERAVEIAKQTGRIFIHPYEDFHVIAGQGVVALEVLEQIERVDTLICSIGGGGLLSGIASVFSQKSPKTELIGCQAAGANPMVRAFREGREVKNTAASTFADGIAVSQASGVMLKLLQGRVRRIETADDEAIAAAVLTLVEKAKTVTEGAGALPLAILDQLKDEHRGKNVVLVVSGGNIDVNLLSRILERGLIRMGRRLVLDVVIEDYPGALAQLAKWVADQGANILQVIHERGSPETQLTETGVRLTLETKGPDHQAQVIHALKENSIQVMVHR